MKKKCEKALSRARKKGFDHGFNTAKMIFADIVASLIEKHQRELEALNSELILGTEEEEDEDEQRLDS